MMVKRADDHHEPSLYHTQRFIKTVECGLVQHSTVPYNITPELDLLYEGPIGPFIYFHYLNFNLIMILTIRIIIKIINKMTRWRMALVISLSKLLLNSS